MIRRILAHFRRPASREPQIALSGPELEARLRSRGLMLHNRDAAKAERYVRRNMALAQRRA